MARTIFDHRLLYTSFRSIMFVALATLFLLGSVVQDAAGQGIGEPIVPSGDEPSVWFTHSPIFPQAGDLIRFEAVSQNGDLVSFQWDTTGDEAYDRAGRVIQRSYLSAGEYPVTLTAHDRLGRSASVTRIVRVGLAGVRLSITSQPPGLTVYIDGERHGTTPLDVFVKPGRRSIRLRHYWLGQWESELDLRHISAMSLDVDLAGFE